MFSNTLSFLSSRSVSTQVLFLNSTDTVIENAKKFEILFEESTWDLGISGNFLLQRMS